MSELGKLKKENKRLKSLLKSAVKLLNTYKDYLKHPEGVGSAARVAPDKGAGSRKPRKKSAKAK